MTLIVYQTFFYQKKYVNIDWFKMQWKNLIKRLHFNTIMDYMDGLVNPVTKLLYEFVNI